MRPSTEGKALSTIDCGTSEGAAEGEQSRGWFPLKLEVHIVAKGRYLIMCATRSVVEYATDVVLAVGLAIDRHSMPLLRVLEKDADDKPHRSRACVWDVGVQVRATWRRAKGKASASYAYGPTFSFDYEKKRKKRRRREEK